MKEGKKLTLVEGWVSDLDHVRLTIYSKRPRPFRSGVP
jgi:hypothetical protein